MRFLRKQKVTKKKVTLRTTKSSTLMITHNTRMNLQRRTCPASPFVVFTHLEDATLDNDAGDPTTLRLRALPKMMTQTAPTVELPGTTASTTQLRKTQGEQFEELLLLQS